MTSNSQVIFDLTESSDMDVSSDDEVMNTDQHEELVQSLRNQIRRQDNKRQPIIPTTDTFMSSGSGPSNPSSYSLQNDKGYESDSSYHTAPDSPSYLTQGAATPGSRERTYDELEDEVEQLRKRQKANRRECEQIVKLIRQKKNEEERINLKMLELNVRISIKKHKDKPNGTKRTTPIEKASKGKAPLRRVTPVRVSPMELEQIGIASSSRQDSQKLIEQDVPYLQRQPQQQQQKLQQQVVLDENHHSPLHQTEHVSHQQQKDAHQKNQPARLLARANIENVSSASMNAIYSQSLAQEDHNKASFEPKVEHPKHEQSQKVYYQPSADPEVAFSFKPLPDLTRMELRKLVRSSHRLGLTNLGQMRAQLCDLYLHARSHGMNTRQMANVFELLKRVITRWDRPDSFIPTHPHMKLNSKNKLKTSNKLLLQEDFYGNAFTFDYDTFEVTPELLADSVQFFVNNDMYHGPLPPIFQRQENPVKVGQMDEVPTQRVDHSVQSTSQPVSQPPPLPPTIRDDSNGRNNIKVNSEQQQQRTQPVLDTSKARSTVLRHIAPKPKLHSPYPSTASVSKPIASISREPLTPTPQNLNEGTSFRQYESPLGSLGISIASTPHPSSMNQPKPEEFNKLCMAESTGGICNDAGCPFTHFRDFQ